MAKPAREVWEKFYGPNLGYIQEQYELFKQDPHAVEESLQVLFKELGAPVELEEDVTRQKQVQADFDLSKIVSAIQLVDHIRTYGHLAANIAPITETAITDEFLNCENYQLTKEDLEAIPAKTLWEHAPTSIENGYDVVKHLKKVYTKTLAYEFSHIHGKEEREWLDRYVETELNVHALSNDEKKKLLHRLVQVEGFEKFLHKTFVGQKRFSIEGTDMLVPMLDDLAQSGRIDGVKDVMIGMAHRGRLNVLAHVLGKPYEHILSEFHHSPNKELIPSEGSRGINYGWSGDVKYHLGGNREIAEENKSICVTLANNPSHLEFVNPVVEGYTRAAQETRDEKGFPKQDTQKAFAVLIHGDSAFPGEGVVPETLNLSRLTGYQTGGTIHIIANNTIGFTTESRDSRSTRYASDLAKGFEIPIIHVNADDPLACIAAVRIAYQYRKQFKKDILIDLIGYRRFGHNEMDDPEATQPLKYQMIRKHPTVMTSFAETLQSENVITQEEFKRHVDDVHEQLQSHYERLTAREVDETTLEHVVSPISDRLPKVETAVQMETLKKLNQQLIQWPEDFNVYPKLEKILKRRAEAFAQEQKVDWSLSEAFALATILAEGKPIRITGQDSERGTFAHRHVVLHDQKTNEGLSPLHYLPSVKASFAIHNSPLTETAVLSFEYGYNVHAPETLVIWEAQFGDFVNVAQVVIDQFIAAGRAKWGQKSSLVMLLPHGYEGQGPEHSSGRVERFLQSAAENNWIVANVTTAAQYFHILRRQAAVTEMTEARPLIIMTPKSLLRHSKTVSLASELSEGTFKPVLEQTHLGENKQEVERLILCTGKVSVDLATRLDELEEDAKRHFHILRMEQLYPFPKQEIEQFLNEYTQVKELVWVQEEPQNMGAWTYMEPYLRAHAPSGVTVSYIGRPRRSSTAIGEPNIHKHEQEKIVSEALRISKGGVNRGRN